MKKIVTVLLAVVLASSMFTGCKKGIDPNDPQKLEVYVYNAGYGYKWCEDLVEAFAQQDWVKEKYPQLKVKVEKDEVSTTAQNLLTATKKVNKYEVVMGTGLERLLGPDVNALDLTESVYNSEVPGEGVLFKDKMIDSYLTSAAYIGKQASADKKYYQVNWASGMTGIIYNEDKLNALGFTVPNTTDELLKIMWDVKALNGANPAYGSTESFATYGESSYVHYLYYTWWAQYQTAEEYVNFYNGIDKETESLSPAVFRQKGRLKTLETLEEILQRQNGLTWVSANTGREAYRETQNRILLGTSLFMANGDWVDSELDILRQGLIEQNGRADTVKMMRTPIISAIIEKTPSIPDDATLSKVVAAIDEGKTEYENVTPADFNTIKEAREVVYSIGPGHNAYIPAFASGQGPAVDFLRFLATDTANEIYTRATNGASLPFKYDVKTENPQLFDQLSAMQKGRLEYFSTFDVNVLPSQSSFPLVRYGGLSIIASGNPLVEFTGGKTDKGDYATMAEMLFEREYTYWTEKGNANWNTAVSQAGIK